MITSVKHIQMTPATVGKKNKAHFIELASALAIIDFLEIPDKDLKCEDGQAKKPIYKQFAIKNNVKKLRSPTSTTALRIKLSEDCLNSLFYTGM